MSKKQKPLTLAEIDADADFAPRSPERIAQLLDIVKELDREWGPNLERVFDQQQPRSAEIRAASIGEIRTATFEGNEYVVVPVVALVEGVIHAINAPSSELVLAEEFGAGWQGWNGRPVCAGHPMRHGMQVSANHPEILESYAIGSVFNARLDGKRLLMEAWIDRGKAMRTAAGREILDRIDRKEPIEVSVGTFVVAESRNGAYNGRAYKSIWRRITPDHLAMLSSGKTGACSIEMGCGALRQAEQETDMATVTPEQAEHFKALSALVDFRVLKGGGKDEHPFAYCMETVVPAIQEKGGAVEDPKAFCGWWKAQRSAAEWDESKHPRGDDGKFSGGGGGDDAGGDDAGGGDPKQWRELDDDLRGASSAARLVAFKAMRALLDQVTDALGNAVDTADQLISDEEALPATPETMTQMRAESEAYAVAAARLRVLLAYATQAAGLLLGAQDLARGNLPGMCDAPVQAPGYMEGRDAGARHSGKDQDMVQTVHNNAVALGAKCGSPTEAADAASRNAACGCKAATGEVSMIKTERVKALIDHPLTPWADSDQKYLEGLSDERLAALESHATKLKADADKAASDASAATAAAEKAAQDKAAAEARVAEASKPKTEDEFLAIAPDSIKRMVAGFKAAEASKKDALVSTLKTAQSEYSEDELKAMELPALERLSRVCKAAVPEPQIDFSGRGASRPETQKDDAVPPPPDLTARILESRKQTVN